MVGGLVVMRNGEMGKEGKGKERKQNAVIKEVIGKKRRGEERLIMSGI